MKGVHRVVAGKLKPELAPGFADHIIDALSEFGRDIELPTEFAHVSNAARSHTSVAEIDDLRRGERESLVLEVGVGEGLKQVAGPRPHDAQHRLARGHIMNANSRVRGDVALEPGEIARL